MTSTSRQLKVHRTIALAVVAVVFVVGSPPSHTVNAAELQAGAAKVDITVDGSTIPGRLHVRALVLKTDTATAVLASMDVVSLGQIGYIKNDFLDNVRGRIRKELGIDPTSVIVNTSHCHGQPCDDVEERFFQCVKQAVASLTPVTVGAGRGHEDRIQENRRLIMKDGREIDVRHAYSLPPDADVADVGPIDPEIGILRLDRKDDGRTLAVVYNFAMHPIQGVNGSGNTADITGFSSDVIEDNLSEGTVALFVQGCGGDINPSFYKDVDHPRSARPMGNTLALSTLKAVRRVKTKDDPRLTVLNRVVKLPRADLAERIDELEQRQLQIMRSLGGTSLNLKTFMPLAVKYNLAEEFPSYYSHRYLLNKKLGRTDLTALDAQNRANMKRYISNIYKMEQITRMNANLALLRSHHRRNVESGSRTIDAELCGLRVGNFVMTTFPGEAVVQIGLNIKKQKQEDFSFVAGYTNGYLYYAPTKAQLLKQREMIEGAQEDSECLLAPEWQEIYEKNAVDILKKL